MSPERALNRIGIALIVGGLVFATGKVMLRTARELDPNLVTIRFAHWQVEPGMREAFDAVAEDYMKLNPNVRIEQLPCPGDVYGIFVRTRLVGGDPPELLERGRNMNPEEMVRYFRPYSQWLEDPNPYNEGTQLEGVRWRETFLDGMSGSAGLDTLFDYYAVAISGVSRRMYYNLDLYRRIMGHERLPQNLEGFLEMCRKAEAYAEARDLPLSPVAGSSDNASVIFQPLFQSQTQKLAARLDRLHALRGPNEQARRQELLLDPRAGLDSPEIRRGLELVREVGQYLSDGFMAYNRDDAIFAFSQGRAVALAAGSWDFVGIRDQVAFEIGVRPIPLPQPANPRYGAGVLGRPAEADAGGSVNFYLAQDSANPEQAVDFLRYLTSIEGQRTFVRISTWLPAVRGVEPHPDSAAFAPLLEGYPTGFDLSSYRWGSGDVFRNFTSNIYLLFQPDGGVETFVNAFKTNYAEALAADVQRAVKSNSRFGQRQDPVLAAHYRLMAAGEDQAAFRLGATFHIQNEREAQAAWMNHQRANFLERHGR